MKWRKKGAITLCTLILNNIEILILSSPQISFLIMKLYHFPLCKLMVSIEKQYIFFTQIWFGEWILKVKHSCCVCREFLTLNAYLLNLSYQIWVGYFIIPEIFKTYVETGFWVQNHLMNLCSRAVNSQRLLYSQKAGVKCSY